MISLYEYDCSYSSGLAVSSRFARHSLLGLYAYPLRASHVSKPKMLIRVPLVLVMSFYVTQVVTISGIRWILHDSALPDQGHSHRSLKRLVKFFFLLVVACHHSLCLYQSILIPLMSINGNSLDGLRPSRLCRANRV